MENFEKLDMQKHVRVKLQTNTCTEKPLVIGDPPKYLNTKLANWTDVVVVDGKAYDKEAVTEMIAEISELKSKSLDHSMEIKSFISERAILEKRIADQDQMLNLLRESLQLGADKDLTCHDLLMVMNMATVMETLK